MHPSRDTEARPGQCRLRCGRGLRHGQHDVHPCLVEGGGDALALDGVTHTLADVVHHNLDRPVQGDGDVAPQLDQLVGSDVVHAGKVGVGHQSDATGGRFPGTCSVGVFRPCRPCRLCRARRGEQGGDIRGTTDLAAEHLPRALCRQRVPSPDLHLGGEGAQDAPGIGVDALRQAEVHQGGRLPGRGGGVEHPDAHRQQGQFVVAGQGVGTDDDQRAGGQCRHRRRRRGGSGAGGDLTERDHLDARRHLATPRLGVTGDDQLHRLTAAVQAVGGDQAHRLIPERTVGRRQDDPGAPARLVYSRNRQVGVDQSEDPLAGPLRLGDRTSGGTGGWLGGRRGSRCGIVGADLSGADELCEIRPVGLFGDPGHRPGGQSPEALRVLQQCLDPVGDSLWGGVLGDHAEAGHLLRDRPDRGGHARHGVGQCQRHRAGLAGLGVGQQHNVDALDHLGDLVLGDPPVVPDGLDAQLGVAPAFLRPAADDPQFALRGPAATQDPHGLQCHVDTLVRLQASEYPDDRNGAGTGTAGQLTRPGRGVLQIERRMGTGTDRHRDLVGENIGHRLREGHHTVGTAQLIAPSDRLHDIALAGVGGAVVDAGDVLHVSRDQQRQRQRLVHALHHADHPLHTVVPDPASQPHGIPQQPRQAQDHPDGGVVGRHRERRDGCRKCVETGRDLGVGVVGEERRWSSPVGEVTIDHVGEETGAATGASPMDPEGRCVRRQGEGPVVVVHGPHCKTLSGPSLRVAEVDLPVLR